MIRTYERDVRRWRELGETPVNVADAILEVAETSGELPAMKRPVKFKDHVEIKMASFFIFTRTD
jgi:hypothetical protein